MNDAWTYAKGQFGRATWREHPAFTGCRSGWCLKEDEDTLVWVLDRGAEYVVVVDDARSFSAPRWRISSVHTDVDEALRVGHVTWLLHK